MLNQMTLYPELTLNDEHIEKINKLYGRVAQKTSDLTKKSKQIRRVISEIVFSPGSIGTMLRSEPQMLPDNYLANDDKTVIVGRSRTSRTATKLARLLKLKK
jgi:hypothetical protein